MEALTQTFQIMEALTQTFIPPRGILNKPWSCHTNSVYVTDRWTYETTDGWTAGAFEFFHCLIDWCRFALSGLLGGILSDPLEYLRPAYPHALNLTPARPCIHVLLYKKFFGHLFCFLRVSKISLIFLPNLIS